MEQRAALYFSAAQSGQRKKVTQNISRTPAVVLEARENDRRAMENHRCPRHSSSLGIPCCIDVNETSAGINASGSTAASLECDVLSQLIRGRAAESQRRHATNGAQYLSGKYEMHSTKWKRWPHLWKNAHNREDSLTVPIFKQRSAREKMLLVSSVISREFPPARQSKLHLRSMSFPSGAEKRGGANLSAISLGSVTTVASSFADSSLFPVHSCRHMSMTGTVRYEELEGGFTAAEKRQGCTECFEAESPVGLGDQSAISGEAFSSSIRQSYLVRANVETGKIRGSSQTSIQDDQTLTQHDAECLRPEASSEFRPLPKCVCLRDYAGSPSQKRPPATNSSAASAGSVATSYCSDRPLLPVENFCPCFPSSHPTAHPPREVAGMFERNRGRTSATNAKGDHLLKLAGITSAGVGMHLVASPKQAAMLRKAPALPCPNNPAGEHAAAGVSKEKQDGVWETGREARGKVRTDPAEASSEADFRSHSSHAEKRRHPHAPLLCCAIPPCSPVPQINLDPGIALIHGKVTDNFLTASQKPDVAKSRDAECDAHTKEKSRFEQGTSHAAVPTLEPNALNSNLHQSISPGFSGQLQQALNAVARRTIDEPASAQCTTNDATIL